MILHFITTLIPYKSVRALSGVPVTPVPNTEQFNFLQGKTRIKVRLLRGIVSMGLLIPAPEGSVIGQNIAKDLGITHFEPTIRNSDVESDSEAPPAGIISPIYDVENMLRFADLFNEDELVYVTEKIHGVNARFLWHNNRMWCGSKEEWKKQSEESLWWSALHQNPWVEKYCRKHPGHILYGEVFGSVQSLKYGEERGKYKICIFDILENGQWLPAEKLFSIIEIKTVPMLGMFKFNLKQLQGMAEGDSLIENAKHIREGIVVRPKNERLTLEIGRLQLKIISNGYLSL